MKESVLDRRFLGRLTVEQTIFLAVFALAVVVRLVDLGVRPYHHDESIHAFFSWKITQNGVSDYRYDPVYHGPVLYYSTALMLWLFGDSDFTGRLSAVAFGLAALGFAWPLRRYLGRWGAIAFLVLASFSPGWVYFSRFVRHDIYLAACNLAAVYFAFRYGDTRQPKFLYISAAALSLAFCNKEDMYLVSPLFLLSLAVMMLWGVARREQTLGAVLSETGAFVKESLLPILTSLVVFAIVWAILYTSFGTHPENWNAVSRALDYWWGQHQIKRIGGPWWYYVPLLILYEPLITFPAIALVLAVVTQRPAPDRFTRFTVVWGIGSLGVYGWAQEKVPWLLIPQLLPLTVLAARWFGRAIDSGALLRPSALIPTAAVGCLTIWTMIAANFLWDAPQPDQPEPKRETMLSYVQSTYDIHNKVMRRIEQVGAALQTGTQTRLAVSGNATWPLSWYLRHYPVNWSANVRNIDTPVVIVDKEVAKSTDEALLDKYERIPFQIRGWWEPQWSQANLPKIIRFLIKRQVWSPTGSSDAVMYVYKDLKPGMTFATLTVNPPPAARGYPRAPSFLTAAAVWGGSGSGRGQFNEPRGLAFDGNGNLYVADSKNHRIQKFGPTGEVLAVWGSEGSGPGQFKDPQGIAIGPDGSVYVADTWNHRIQQFDANGTFVREWAAKDPGFWGPRGIAVSPDGKVYVTDTGNKRVASYTADGRPLEVWGTDGSAPGQLIEPVGIAINQRREVIVADTGNRRIQIFQPEGAFIKEFNVYGWEEFYTEPHIALSGDDIYVTDSYNHRIARYRDGQLTGVWGKTGAGSGDFNRPIGIAVSPSGAVFVADTLNHRVQKFEVPPAEAAPQ